VPHYPFWKKISVQKSSPNAFLKNAMINVWADYIKVKKKINKKIQ